MPSPRRPIAFFGCEILEPRALRSTTITVQSYYEYGAFTLGSAIEYGSPGDTIDLTALRGTITLQSTLPLTQDVKIVGPGSGLLTLEGGDGNPAFSVAPGVTASLSGITIDGASAASAGGGISVDGSADNTDAPAKLTLDHVVVSNCSAAELGGGLYAAFCDVTMTDCRFTGNTVTGAEDALGGGVYLTDCTLNASGCTFDNNSAVATGSTVPYDNLDTSAMGGGLCLLGAGDTVLTDCTIAANTVTATPDANAVSTATTMGAGLLLAGMGDFTMQSCTVASNICSDANAAQGFGGGVAVLSFGTDNADGSDTFEIANSILGNNYAAVGKDGFGLDVSASAQSVIQDNVLSVLDDSGVTGGVDGNVGGALSAPLDPGIDALADNGGPTPTMALRAGSPALGIAQDSPALDQRGQPRAAALDAGAYESDLNLVPTLDTAPLTTASTDHWFSATLTASDPGVTISVANAPAWLTVTDGGNGTAVLTGTPTWDDDGAQRVTLNLTDGGQSYQQTFAVDVAITPAAVVDGVLHVSGSDGNDTLHVWQPRGSGTAYRVAIGRRVRNYAFGDVTAIEIFGRAGDDTIISNCVDLGVQVNAGDGNDTVTGGPQSDTLSGGNGDDFLYGMGGDDKLGGNGGRDYLDGGAGDDRLYGGNGHDTLDGGLGNDVMYGDGGPDFFISNDGGRDYLFGGPNGISAGTFDRRDVVSDVIAYIAAKK